MLSSVHSWTPLGLHAVCSQKWNLCPASRISCSETCRICTAAYSLCANFNKKSWKRHIFPILCRLLPAAGGGRAIWPDHGHSAHFSIGAVRQGGEECCFYRWQEFRKLKFRTHHLLTGFRWEVPHPGIQSLCEGGWDRSEYELWTINLKNNFTEFILFNVKMGKFHLSYCPFRLFQIWRNFHVLRFF